MLYYNTLLLHKIDKIKIAGTIREISSVMTSLDYASPIPWLRSPASIVARRAITLIVRLGT